jgi:hypothetical protein
MTQEEIEAAWIRYMHRSDLEADLVDTWLFASSATVNELMYAPIVFDEILADAPQIMLHSGLVYLAELAQDDVQLERETMKFKTSADAWMMHRSIQIPAVIGA